jgi:hypothetical protein
LEDISAGPNLVALFRNGQHSATGNPVQLPSSRVFVYPTAIRRATRTPQEGLLSRGLCAIMLHESQEAMASVKTIGSSGQIALGKEYAGRHVLIDEVERGVWIVKLGDFIPDSERWLHRPEVSRSLDRAIAWAEKHPPRKTNLENLAKRLKK